MHQDDEKTELEKAAVAEKKKWLKEEEEGEPLLVSITLPQVHSFHSTTHAILFKLSRTAH